MSPLAELGLVETTAHVLAEVLVTQMPFEKCVGVGPELVLRRVHSAGPLVHRSDVPDRVMSIGHQIHLDGALSKDELARFARDYGATFDAAKKTLSLRTAIGLEAVYVSNAIEALRPGIRAALELHGTEVCMD